MIKINLIQGKGSSRGGTEESTVLSDESSIKKEALKRILIILIFPMGLYVYESQNIPEKKQVIDRISQQINELKTYNSKLENSAKQIEQFKVEEAQFNTQVQALTKITKSRKIEVKIFSLIQNVIPEKVWLREISIDRAAQGSDKNEIRIVGYSATNEDVRKFIEALEKSVYLKKIEPDQSTSVTLPGYGAQSFRNFVIKAESGVF